MPTEILRIADSSDFVGRAQELMTFRSLLDGARREEGQVALLVGEPGVGKTRMMREFAAAARDEGALVLMGSWYEGDWAPPYGPWMEALADLAALLPAERVQCELGPDASLVAAVLPWVSDIRESTAQSSRLDPDAERHRLHDGIVRLLLVIARDQPLVLLLDDLHWGDHDSLALLRTVARAATRGRLLIVVSYRDGEVFGSPPVADLLGVLQRESDCTRIVLRGFTREELTDYLARMAGPTLPGAMVEVIHAETAGNPFYVREVFRHLVEEGKLVRRGEDWWTDFSVNELGVPEGVRQVVGHRLARLSPETATVLHLAAAFPGGVSFSVLAALADLPDERLLDALDEALATGLIRSVDERNEMYDFAHAIVRHTLYDALSPSRRGRLHRRIAETLELAYSANPEPHLALLAYHWGKAAPGVDAAKSVDYAARAAERAARLLAFEEAADHYAQALAALDVMVTQSDASCVATVARDERRCSLLLGLAEAKSGAGRPDEAREDFRRAHAVARSLLERDERQTAAPLLARAALGIAGMRGTAGRVDPAIVALLEQSARAFAGHDHPLHARVLTRLAMELFYDRDGGRDRRRMLSAEAVAMAGRLDDPPARAFALSGRHYVFWELDNVQERLAIAAEAASLAEAVGDKESLTWTHIHRVGNLLELGDMAAVDAEIAAVDHLAEELRLPLFRSARLTYRAMQALLVGQFEHGITLAQQAFAIGRHAGGENSALYFGVQRFLLRREQGRLAELEDAMRDFVQRFPQFPSWRAGLATLYADLGRESEARREFEHFAQTGFTNVLQDMSWAVVMNLLAELCARLGDARRAGVLHQILRPYAGRAVVAGNAVACMGAVSHYLGLLAATTGQYADAERSFEDALALNARMGAATFLAHTQFAYARMLLDRGRERERAVALLAEANETAETLGMSRLLEQTRKLQERLAASARGGPAGLTTREVEVLRLLAAGETGRAIAQALTVSVSTAERHIANLYAKIGARGRADAIAYALRHDLAGPPPGS